MHPSSVLSGSVWGVKLDDTVLMGCTDPLRRGVGAPYQRPLGVGSKRPLARDADVRAFR